MFSYVICFVFDPYLYNYRQISPIFDPILQKQPNLLESVTGPHTMQASLLKKRSQAKLPYNHSLVYMIAKYVDKWPPCKIVNQCTIAFHSGSFRCKIIEN